MGSGVVIYVAGTPLLRGTAIRPCARLHPPTPAPHLGPSCRFDRKAEATSPVVLPAGATAAAALDRVLRLPSVCSKRFLTTKVDRCVTGLIAQQQCVGPLQLPISDVAVMAQTHFGLTGAATSIGEQPLKARPALPCCMHPAQRAVVCLLLRNLSSA